LPPGESPAAYPRRADLAPLDTADPAAPDRLDRIRSRSTMPCMCSSWSCCFFGVEVWASPATGEMTSLPPRAMLVDRLHRRGRGRNCALRSARATPTSP